jgi:tRNA pseudouridine38-40 synthase
MLSSDSDSCTKNIRLVVEYDGEDFCGWQRQASDPSIQATLEDILTKIHCKKIIVVGAGRTDSGVHAEGQVAHFHTDREYEPSLWRAILNSDLPPTIRIRSSELVPQKFHAQKDARSKLYVYRILNRSYASALDRRVLLYPFELDWNAIKKACKNFEGTHDFKAFQAAGASVKTTIRTLYRCEVVKADEHLYEIEFEGDGFLKQMVRTIVGTLVEVGEGKKTADDIIEILRSRNRKRAGRTVLPQGLVLREVRYS